MKLELKNVKIHPDMSEETTCFSATLWVDGKRAASCRNDGRGGSTDVFFFDGNRSDLATKVYQYCKENPFIQWDGIKKYEFDSIEVRIDEMVFEYELRNVFKKGQKNLLFLRLSEKKDPDYVYHETVNLGYPINVLLSSESGRKTLKTAISKAKADGYEIMNTNIDFDLLSR